MSSLLDKVAQPPAARPLPPINNGRYEIPDPETGLPRKWTRGTTWADTLNDRYNLEQWGARMVARGVAEREDLRMGILAVRDPLALAGKRKLDEFAGQAKDHAGSKYRATIGSAVHEFLESIDGGYEVEVPEPYDQDVAAYVEAKKRGHVQTSANYIERIVTVPALGVAGQIDRVVKLKNSRLPLIADIKTGTDLGYSWTQIAVQLALYAHGETIWDEAQKQHYPMPKVNQNIALVFHLPAREGRCELYGVDIAAGWEAALLAGEVRKWRQRRDLATSLEKP